MTRFDAYKRIGDQDTDDQGRELQNVLQLDDLYSACQLYMRLFLQKPTSATTQQDGLDLDTYITALQDDNTTSLFPTKISHISVQSSTR